MASERATSHSAVTIRQRSRPKIWLWWVPITLLGAVLGALAAWQIRSLAASSNSDTALSSVRYLATIASAVVASGAQWWILRDRFDVYWWVPATVGADLLGAIIVIPSMLRLVLPPVALHTVPASVQTSMLASALALAAAGLLVGGAQAFILRLTVGNAALLWLAATVLGGALAGATTDGFSPQILSLPPIASISLAAGLGSVLTAIVQLPVLARLSR